MDEATPQIQERHVFDATNRYGEIEPKQETALEELGLDVYKRQVQNNQNHTLHIQHLPFLLVCLII